MKWKVDREDTTESFLELWVASQLPDQGSCNVTVSLSQPQHGASNRSPRKVSAGPGECMVLRGGRDAPENVAAVINATGQFQSPNGSPRLVLVALGHSAGNQPRADTGDWVVSVANRDTHPVAVRARLERRDIPGELAGYRPQYGFDPEEFGPATFDTLGTLANGFKTIVVGAVSEDKETKSLRISAYSSRGAALAPSHAHPAGSKGPHIVAMGMRTAAGFLSGSSKSLAGTSMAAAQVTAALAAIVSSSGTKLMDQASKLAALKELAAPTTINRRLPPPSQGENNAPNGLVEGFVFLPPT